MLAETVERVEKARARVRRASDSLEYEYEEGDDSVIEGCVWRLFLGWLMVGACTIGVCVCLGCVAGRRWAE